MTALVLKVVPWLAGILVLLSVGAYVGYRANPWQARYHALQLTDARARADGEAVVRRALTERLAEAQATSANNADSLVRLANENAQLTTDRDANVALAHRLLASEARSAAANHPVSKTASEPTTATASGAGENDSLAQLVADVGDECARNADRFDALIAQIRPQL